MSTERESTPHNSNLISTTHGHIDLDSRMAFARLVRPETRGLDESEYDDITDEMLELAKPEALAVSLYDLPRFNDFTSSYFNPVLRRRVHVALTPRERKKVARSPADLGATVLNDTLASRPPRKVFTADVAAAKRTKVHVLQNSIRSMSDYRSNALTYEAQQINFFREAAYHPGLSRGKEISVRAAMAYVEEYTFEFMFEALRLQRGWNTDQDSLARRAVQKRLYLQREKNTHIQNWRDMLDMLQTWNGFKTELFTHKIEEAEEALTT